MSFEDGYFPDGPLVDGVRYPTNAAIAKHALKYLARNAFCCCIALYLVVIPVYDAYFKPLNISDVALNVLFVQGVCHTLFYIVGNGFFFAMDYFKLLQKYKQKRTPAQEPSRELMLKTLREAFVFHMFVLPAAMYVIGIKYHVEIPRDAPLPSFPIVFLHFVGANATNEVLFFLLHKTVHIPRFYWIHKKHHNYIGPRSIATQHATLLEEITANIGSTVIYCTLLRLPLPIFGCWMLSRMAETFEAHSGYCFKGSLMERIGLTHSYRADFHDYHHTQNLGNYGTALFMDMIFRTMTPYLKMKERERLKRHEKNGSAVKNGKVE